jgi:hypothetical protein
VASTKAVAKPSPMQSPATRDSAGRRSGGGGQGAAELGVGDRWRNSTDPAIPASGRLLELDPQRASVTISIPTSAGTPLASRDEHDVVALVPVAEDARHDEY